MVFFTSYYEIIFKLFFILTSKFNYFWNTEPYYNSPNKALEGEFRSFLFLALANGLAWPYLYPLFYYYSIILVHFYQIFCFNDT